MIPLGIAVTMATVVLFMCLAPLLILEKKGFKKTYAHGFLAAFKTATFIAFIFSLFIFMITGSSTKNNKKPFSLNALKSMDFSIEKTKKPMNKATPFITLLFVLIVLVQGTIEYLEQRSNFKTRDILKTWAISHGKKYVESPPRPKKILTLDIQGYTISPGQYSQLSLNKIRARKGYFKATVLSIISPKFRFDSNTIRVTKYALTGERTIHYGTNLEVDKKPTPKEQELVTLLLEKVKEDFKITLADTKISIELNKINTKDQLDTYLALLSSVEDHFSESYMLCE